MGTPVPGILGPRPGIVVGMPAEARALAGLGRTVCADGRPDRAEALARDLVREGCTPLVSAGVCGGLDPALAPGDLIAGTGVVSENGAAFPAATDLHTACVAAAQAAGLAVRCGPLIGVDKPAVTAAGKAALRAHADGVDMESLGVARAATALAVPLVILRVVADPAGRSLPWPARADLAEDGSPRVLTILARLAVTPWSLPGLVALGRDMARATRTLRRLPDILVRPDHR